MNRNEINNRTQSTRTSSAQLEQGITPASGSGGSKRATASESGSTEQPMRPVTREDWTTKAQRSDSAQPGIGSWLAVQTRPEVKKPEVSPTSLKQLRLDARPDVSYMKSPTDWRDEPMYFALLDRFNRGEGAVTIGEPSDHDSLHGGNLKGLIAKLDYIQGLGCTAVWVSPVVKNPRGTYHGYAPENFCAVDPSKGSMEDMRTLVREAHRRGMRVVLDMVLNHSCDAFDYVDGDKNFNYQPTPPKEIKGFKRPIYPIELRAPENYARRGAIRDWENPEESETGDFYNYKAFDLERPETQDMLIKISKWWMRETGADGLRCDAVKHISTKFWSRFNTEIRAHARKLGMENFMLLGEAFDYDSNKVAAYMKLPKPPEQTDDRKDSGFGLMFDIPTYLKSAEALHGRAATAKLEAAFHDASRSLEGAPDARYTNLIDSHDVPRFLRPGEDPAVLAVGLAQALFSVGQPCIYYGTEQGFQDRMDIDKTLGDRGRTDMFDGAFKSPGKSGDSFDTESPGYRMLQRFNEVRRTYPALQRGQQFPRWNNADHAGVYAFSRILDRQEVVVMLNSSDQPQKVQGMWVDRELTRPGTELVDVLDPQYRVVTRGGNPEGSQLDFEIPPRSARVLVARSQLSVSDAAR